MLDVQDVVPENDNGSTSMFGREAICCNDLANNGDDGD